MSEQKPSVGRVVHYYGHSHLGDLIGPRAALVTGLRNGTGGIDLCVFLNESTDKGRARTVHKECVSYSEEPKPYCWTWPPRT